MIVAPLVALLSAQPAPAAPVDGAVPSVLHVFADWTVACDNGRQCQASSLMPEPIDPDKARIMTVERGPAPDAALALVLPNIDAAPARLTVGDDPVDAQITPSGEDEFMIVPRDRNALLDQLGIADTLTLRNAAGASIGEVSLRGLREALLYIDEVQGRLETVTALVERGARPAAAVPRAPAVPLVQVAPLTQERAATVPAAQVAQLRHASGCDEVGVAGMPTTAETYALGGGKTLLLLSCGAGAYNLSSVPYVVSGSGRALTIVPARFDVAIGYGGDERDRRVPLITNAEWDASRMTLTEYVKGRGLGDCGAHSDYAWDGAQFRLTLRQEMGECRGSINFLNTWRADLGR